MPTRRLRSRLLPALLPGALAAAALPPAAGAARAPQAAPVLRAVPAASATTVRALQHRLDVALGGGSATVVGAAVDVDGVGALYRRGASAALVPASTEKLFTTLAALRLLGPTGTLSTQVRTAAPLVAGALQGDLYLVGGGDPFLTGAQLDRLAAAVASAGVRAVTGYLHLDDYRYDQVHAGPGWKPQWVPEESGPLSALAVDRNGWRTDASFLADPSAANTRRFQQLLVRHGV
ncbi:MAG: D-alanyl-D-alanine carboxypeptidase, partial [Mycobacteriales bacterium]